MAETVRNCFSLIWLVLPLLAFPATASAHRLDEYLQATLVVVEPDRVRLQINLTPGVAVAEQVLALIDSDKDGLISTNEAAAYSELLRQDLVLRLDERTLELKSSAFYFPELAELRSGLGIIQIEFSAPTGPLAAGVHALTLENRHLAKVSVYLVNAALPASHSIQISKQIRNENQSVGEIQFSCHPPPGSFNALSLVALLLILLSSVSVGLIQKRKPSHKSQVAA